MVAANFDHIWNAYCCRLLAFLKSRLSDDDQAEELLQEVFLRVHQHLCCLPQPDKMDSWIFQIARNLVIDHYRKRREMVELSDELPCETELFEDDQGMDLALSLKDMVDQLPEPYREALLLTEYQGLSQVELAGRLGLSVSAVKSRVQRGRDKLRDLILACCHIELDRRGRIIDYYERCCCCNPDH